MKIKLMVMKGNNILLYLKMNKNYKNYKQVNNKKSTKIF
jgi:hypothetical protein